MLGLISGILGGLGGLFGDSGESSTDESFTKDSTTTGTASTTDLSSELLSQLESLFSGNLDSFTESTDAMGTRLDQLQAMANEPEFDVAGFSKGVTDQATAAAGLDLESSINGMLSQGNITETGNSAGALLGNKMRNETAANLAGISAQATATGEAIRQQQQKDITEGITGLSSSLSQSILSLIQGTRGATQTGDSTTTEKSSGTGTSESESSSSGSIFESLASIFGSFGNAKANA